MTRQQIISLVRQLISDEQEVGFTAGGEKLEKPEGTDELLNYLDRATDTYSEERAAAGDIELLKALEVNDDDPLPEDFIKFAGLVPIDVVGNKMSFYGDATTLRVKYFARMEHMSKMGEDDELPYNLDECRKFAALAAIYALNKHEFTVSQDLMLLGMGGGGSANGR